MAYKKEKEEMELLISTIKWAMIQEVESEEKDGKKVYTNEKKREIECNRRLKTDQVYQSNISRLNNLTESIQKSEIDVSYLGRMFRAAESIAFLGRY